MKTKTTLGLVAEGLRLVCALLPTLFWVLVIFGFEEPAPAVATLLTALIHEFGHIGYIWFSGGKALNIRGVLSGMRIGTSGLSSYKDKILTYLWGPMANFIASLIFLVLAPLSSFFPLMAIMNIATALSNLLPIEEYDGYGIIKTYIEMKELGDWYLRALYALSSMLIFLLCILSLYLIDRYGRGYWIFAVYFFSMIKHFKKELKE